MRKHWLSRPARQSPPLQGDPTHLAKLREGREAWNCWRRDEREKRKTDLVPLLMGFNLRGAVLDEYDLSGVNLQEAVLRRTSLRGAELRGALFLRADLRSANLEGAWLDNKESDLRDADLRRAILSEVLLDEADIRGARGVVLDSTRVRNARFSSTAKDPWSVLRKNYTGPRLILNYIFLIAFLVPYILKAAGWIGVSRIEAAVGTGVACLADKAEATAEKAGEWNAQAIRGVKASVEKHVPSKERGWREYSLWQVMIGFDRSIWYWATAVALIVYNLLRSLLTILVAPLRDEEERSGHSPAYLPKPAPSASLTERVLNTLVQPLGWLERYRNAYGWMIWPHRVVSVLFVFAVGAFLIHTCSWLVTPILLPPA